MTILGLDPGSAITGFGIIHCAGNTITVTDFGVLRTTPDMTTADRLHVLAEDLLTLIHETKIDSCAIEQLFFTKNRTTGIKVAQARGVLLETVRRKKIPLHEYTPSEIKTAVTGYGNADKKQMQRMVQILLKLDTLPKPDDAADALAVALCHATLTKFHTLIGTAQKSSFATV